MKILGVDPGILNLGYAAIAPGSGKIDLLNFGTIRPAKGLSHPQRLFFIYEKVSKLVKEVEPDYISCEDFLPRVNPESSAKVAQAQAVVLLLAGKHRIPVKLYHPSTWRSLVAGSQSPTTAGLRQSLQVFCNGSELSEFDEHSLSALGLALSLALEVGVL